jgi:hypothetical protein
MDEALALVAQMIRNYNWGGSGYTWLDAMIDVVGEHGYTILSDNGDGDGPAAIFINDETLASTRELVDRLRQIGQAVDSATGSDLDELDEEAAEIDGILSDLLVSLLVDAGLVEPLVVSEDS